MKSGGFRTRAAAPSAPRPAEADRGFVVGASIALGATFLAACALAIAQFSVLLAS